MENYAGIKIVFGAVGRAWNDDAKAAQMLDIFREEGVKDFDSARAYPNSEESLGARGIPNEFIVSTKFSGLWLNVPATRENILQSAETSFGLLKTDQVDVYYLHGPDRKTPLEETLGAIDELYKQGRFRRFGLSNFLPKEVEEVIRVAKEKGFVAPTVYQGSYSAVARKPEEELLPLLRKHGFAFYAYSPIAGGFLTKTREQIEAGEGLRWGRNSALSHGYLGRYGKPSFLDALSTWEAISVEEGIPKAELAFRWIAHNSALKKEHGDALVFGASSPEQVRDTVRAVKKGPISQKAAKQIDELWDLIKADATLDNFNTDA
ncbi:putative aldehyde reductase [Thozetella sp. PMI_491]|nr:putative aldehyde reductase [Thozetella sp. PMI_491]